MADRAALEPHTYLVFPQRFMIVRTIARALEGIARAWARVGPGLATPLPMSKTGPVSKGLTGVLQTKTNKVF